MPPIVTFAVVAYVVGLTPYALFSTYVLRLITTAHRTLVAGPFILKDDVKRGQIEWKDRSVGDATDAGVRAGVSGRAVGRRGADRSRGRLL